MMYKVDDADLGGARATWASVLHALTPGVKFTITRNMIQLLNLKEILRGATGDDVETDVVSTISYWRGGWMRCQLTPS